MKLLKVIIILSSIFVFSANARGGELSETEGSFEKMPYPTFLGEGIEYSMPAFLFRLTQFMRFKLNKKEKKQHESAVFFMLDNVENGKIVSWYSDKRLANGKVRVIHSYPISGGYCRTYQAYIKLNGTERHMTNNACKYIGTSSWSFYK
tara:strand:+ start:171 stop:617 length:447 start_codon:yes stop_codon:yes gene_type:complete